MWKSDSWNPDEVAWLGQFRTRTCPEVMRAAALSSGIPFPDLPANWKVLYGIAGLVAEEVLGGETDDAGVIADAVRYKISNGEASATDLAATGITDIDDYQLDDDVVEEAVRMLRQEWTGVKQEVEYLIEFAVADTFESRRRLSVWPDRNQPLQLQGPCRSGSQSRWDGIGLIHSDIYANERGSTSPGTGWS
ncbi:MULTISPECIES: hypothetical protein [Paraburkholderia]|uniref:hypothetical protein n=1 Tax=Paraburkholderia TaxID=1822464 RepID=UPI00165628D9|nr:hypothetical protein [Paraburkholderia podalyriae]